MELIYNPCEYELVRAIRARKEAKVNLEGSPEYLSKGAQRERAGNLRLALVKALIASGEQAYYSARVMAAANPEVARAVYLEACATHGIEPTEIDL